MQKQLHKQSASTGSRRFYIDIAPDLVKHAQKLRKQAAIEATGPDTWAEIPLDDDQWRAEMEEDEEIRKQEARIDEQYESYTGGNAGDSLPGSAGDVPAARWSEYWDEEAKKKEEAEEKEASWFYQKSPNHPDLTGNELRYNKNLSWILGAGGVGLGVGGLAALTQMMRRPPVQDMARPAHSANLPIELSIPQRKKRLRRKPEEEEGEEDQLDKAASGIWDSIGAGLKYVGQAANPLSPWPGGSSAPPGPSNILVKPAVRPGSQKIAPGPDIGMLGDEAWQHTMTVPAMGLAAGGGFIAANAVGDYLAKRRRKKLREKAVRDAKEDYESAIAEQFVGSDVKAATASSELSAELDALHEDYVKIAKFNGSFNVAPPKLPWVGDIDLPSGQDIKNVIGIGGGALATLALVTGIPAAMLTYDYARKKHKRHQPLSEAMRRRKAELARRRPTPIYLTPGEEVVHEEDEDEPVVESV